MTTETVHARLRGFGVPPTSSTIVVEHLGLSRRLARAAVALGLGVAAAAVALPIPIVHFVLVPGSLLLGLVFAGASRSGMSFDQPKDPAPSAVLASGWDLPAGNSACPVGYTAHPAAGSLIWIRWPESAAAFCTTPPFAPRLAF
jgi:hypothetical protein